MKGVLNSEVADKNAGHGGGLAAAARDAGVVWAGMFFLGIGFGALVTGHGLPWWLAPAISGLMFAGSAEFILVAMLAVSAPIAAMALTTFLINSRHVFYGLSFPLDRVGGRLGRAYSVFALCDEAFAILGTKDPATLTSARMLWTQAGMHASWTGGSLVGAVVGTKLLQDVEGLEFLLTALFVVLTMDAFRASRDRMTLATATTASALAFLVLPGSMVLSSMVAFTLVMVLRYRWALRAAIRSHAGGNKDG